MRAGKLDRRITIQRLSVVGTTAMNEPVKEWIDLATVWAQALPMRGNERFAAQQIAGTAIMTFRLRYRDVQVTDRIRYGDKVWNIKDVREIGRRVGLDVDCVARQD